MTIKISKSAHQDLLDGYIFYEKQKKDLGDYFLKTLFADIDTLQDIAGVHTQFFNYYRKLSHTFPFAIYYKIINDVVHIYAVLDYRRKPSWIRDKVEKLS